MGGALEQRGGVRFRKTRSAGRSSVKQGVGGDGGGRAEDAGAVGGNLLWGGRGAADV